VKIGARAWLGSTPRSTAWNQRSNSDSTVWRLTARPIRAAPRTGARRAIPTIPKRQETFQSQGLITATAARPVKQRTTGRITLRCRGYLLGHTTPVPVCPGGGGARRAKTPKQQADDALAQAVPSGPSTHVCQMRSSSQPASRRGRFVRFLRFIQIVVLSAEWKSCDHENHPWQREQDPL
jgi:hypothetical protein